MMPDQVRKWLRQHSEDFYDAGFEAPVKRWDKCISVGGGHVEKYFFFQFRISHVLRFISICYLFADSSSYITESYLLCDDIKAPKSILYIITPLYIPRFF
jgi:hypothetical protein